MSRRKLHRLSLCSSASLVLALFAELPNAYAQSEPVTANLDWGSPPDAPCLARDALVRSVESRLQRRVFVDGASGGDVRLLARITRGGSGWHADLDLRELGGRSLGTRHVESADADCADLTRSLPLVVALLIDFPRRDLPPTVLSPPAPSVAPSTPPAPTAPLPSARRPATQVVVGLDGRTAWGTLPGWGFGGDAFVGVEADRGWSAEVVAGGFAPTSARLPTGSANFALAYAGLSGCAPMFDTPAKVALLLCGGMRLGSVFAKGRGFDANASETRLVPEATGSVRLQLPLGPSFFARIAADVSIAWSRVQYEYRAPSGTVTPLFEMRVISPGFGIGFGVRFR